MRKKILLLSFISILSASQPCKAGRLNNFFKNIQIWLSEKISSLTEQPKKNSTDDKLENKKGFPDKNISKKKPSPPARKNLPHIKIGSSDEPLGPPESMPPIDSSK